MTTLKGNTTVSHRSEKTLHDLAQKTDQQTLPRVSLAEFQAARICLSWICKAISWKYYAGDPSPKNIQKSFHIFPHHPSIPRYSKYSTPSLPPSFRVTAPRAPDICTATTHLGHAATRSTAQHRAATRSTSRFIEVHRGSSVCSQGAVAKFRLAIAGPRWHHLRQRLVEIVPHTFARKTKNNQKDAILNEVLMTYFNWLQLTSS